MNELPQQGERYRHRDGRTTVHINYVIHNPPTSAQFNPEFLYEVEFSYDGSDQRTLMPLTWFLNKYSKIADAPRLPDTAQTWVPADFSVNKTVTYIHYGKRFFQKDKKPETDDTHYSKYL